jgi:hypothetical protein
MFNGRSTLSEIIERLPVEIQDYSIDIVIFLRRWHLLVEVNSVVMNCKYLTSSNQNNPIPEEFLFGDSFENDSSFQCFSNKEKKTLALIQPSSLLSSKSLHDISQIQDCQFLCQKIPYLQVMKKY